MEKLPLQKLSTNEKFENNRYWCAIDNFMGKFTISIPLEEENFDFIMDLIKMGAGSNIIYPTDFRYELLEKAIKQFRI